MAFKFGSVGAMRMLSSPNQRFTSFHVFIGIILTPLDPAQVTNNSGFLGDLDASVYVTSPDGTSFLRPLC